MNTVNAISNEAESLERSAENWITIALPYEEKLEDCVSSIVEQCGLTGDEVMPGNGILHKYARNGYVVLSDSGKTMFLPVNCYKGVCDDLGTRVSIGKTRTNIEGTICLDAMECVSVNELKYRLFSSIEDSNMVMAATAAWGIYNNAPDILRKRMQSLIHSLRDEFKRFRRAEEQGKVTFAPCAA